MSTGRVLSLTTLIMGMNGIAFADENPDSQSYQQDIEEVIAYGTKPDRYRATDSSSATGFSAEIQDIPRSIQVITEQTILDQQALNLGDTLKNVSGIQTISNFGNTTDSFIVRGFNVRTIFQDGFRLSNNITRVQTSNIERVEVLKGASALLYGQVQPGGLVNVVTKKPKEETRNFISTTLDENGQQYLLGDFTGSFNENDSLLYRLVASHEDSETFRSAASDSEVKRTTFSPSLTWKISDKDTFNVSLDLIESELPLDRGTTLILNSNGEATLPDIPVSRRLGEDEDLSDTSQVISRISYQHAFSDSLKFEAQIQHQAADADTQENNPLAGVATASLNASPIPGLPAISNLILAGGEGVVTGGPIPENGQLLRRGVRFETDEDNYFSSLRLSGDTDTHQYSVGLDFNSRDSEFDNSLAVLSAAESGLTGIIPLTGDELFTNFTALDIFNPNYGQVNNNFVSTNFLTREDTLFGVYIQDLISINEQLKVLLGLRWDSFERTQNNTFNLTTTDIPEVFLPASIPTPTEESKENELSPNLGIVYQPGEDISLYASYSESFTPNFATNSLTFESVDVDPREGQQIEFGIKGNFLNDTISLGASLFQLDFVNAINGFDAATGNPVLNGEQRSEGIELDASVQFFDGLNVIFNYAYIDAEITRSETNQGNSIAGAAEQTASLWSTYEFTEGSLRGLGFGGGIYYTDDRFIDAANSFELDSFVTADITAWYYLKTGKKSQLRFQVGIKNLTDKEYFQTSEAGSLAINVEEPRTSYGSVTFEF